MESGQDPVFKMIPRIEVLGSTKKGYSQKNAKTAFHSSLYI